VPRVSLCSATIRLPIVKKFSAFTAPNIFTAATAAHVTHHPTQPPSQVSRRQRQAAHWP
jgi:hypothetical protein